MTEFVERLRELAVVSNDGHLRGPALAAADEIERLRARAERFERLYDKAVCQDAEQYKRFVLAEAERDRLRKALDACTSGSYTTIEKSRIARAALEEDND